MYSSKLAHDALLSMTSDEPCTDDLLDEDEDDEISPAPPIAAADNEEVEEDDEPADTAPDSTLGTAGNGAELGLRILGRFAPTLVSRSVQNDELLEGLYAINQAWRVIYVPVPARQHRASGRILPLGYQAFEYFPV